MKCFTRFSVNKASQAALCAFALLLSVLLGLSLGSARLSLPETVLGILEGDSTANGRILLYVRLPRVLAAVFAGSALAVSGAVIQEVLANPLASPGTIGVNAGAGFGAALCSASLGSVAPSSAMHSLMPLASFSGALSAVIIVSSISERAGSSKITLILSGVAISSLLSAGTNLITTLFPDSLLRTHSFQIGGLSGVSFESLFPAGWLILIFILAVLIMGGELDVLSLGEVSATSLGLNVKACKFMFLASSAMLAGSAVSFAGLVGFVGLIVPHVARMVAGTGSSRRLIVLSALIGGAFFEGCDIASRMLFSPYELPTGIVTAFLGAPFFLFLLIKRRRGYRY